MGRSEAGRGERVCVKGEGGEGMERWSECILESPVIFSASASASASGCPCPLCHSRASVSRLMQSSISAESLLPIPSPKHLGVRAGRRRRLRAVRSPLQDGTPHIRVAGPAASTLCSNACSASLWHTCQKPALHVHRFEAPLCSLHQLPPVLDDSRRTSGAEPTRSKPRPVYSTSILPPVSCSAIVPILFCVAIGIQLLSSTVPRVLFAAFNLS